MNHVTTKLIKQHLEYFGYSVEDRSEPNEPSDYLVVTHPRRVNFILHNNNLEVIYIKALFAGYASARRTDLLNELNGINFVTVLTKWRAIEDDENADKLRISIAACQVGYEKNHFSSFIDFFEDEIRTHLSALEQFDYKNNLLLLSQVKK